LKRHGSTVNSAKAAGRCRASVRQWRSRRQTGSRRRRRCNERMQRLEAGTGSRYGLSCASPDPNPNRRGFPVARPTLRRTPARNCFADPANRRHAFRIAASFEERRSRMRCRLGRAGEPFGAQCAVACTCARSPREVATRIELRTLEPALAAKSGQVRRGPPNESAATRHRTMRPAIRLPIRR